MLALFSTFAILTVCFLTVQKYPFLGGLIAVIPVKIISTAIFSRDIDKLLPAVKGMLVGQFLVGIILLLFYIYLIKY